jgi:hypothetical protein
MVWKIHLKYYQTRQLIKNMSPFRTPFGYKVHSRGVPGRPLGATWAPRLLLRLHICILGCQNGVPESRNGVQCAREDVPMIPKCSPRAATLFENWMQQYIQNHLHAKAMSYTASPGNGLQAAFAGLLEAVLEWPSQA